MTIRWLRLGAAAMQAALAPLVACSPDDASQAGGNDACPKIFVSATVPGPPLDTAAFDASVHAMGAYTYHWTVTGATVVNEDAGGRLIVKGRGHVEAKVTVDGLGPECPHVATAIADIP